MKKALAFLLFLCLLFSTVGCDKTDGAGQMVYYEGNTAPKNVDPLLAVSDAELLAVQHLFTPLLQADNVKGIQPAAAESYSVSKDGLTYTFVLRADLVWSDGVAVTAKDFAFNLKRATDPATKAVCAGQLTTLKSAVATNDSTLTITLSAPTEDMLWTLSGVAGMPCRQDFFEGCGGRYGMGKDYVIANGAFYVSRWIDDDNEKYVKLVKHDKFFGAKEVLPAGITLTFLDQTDRLTRLTEEETDCAPVEGSNVQAAKDAKLNTLSHYNDSYSLLMNTQDGAPTANTALRKALLGAIDPDALATYLPDWCEAGSSFVIPDRYYGVTAYHSLPVDDTFRSAEQTEKNFREALQTLEAEQIKHLTLYYVESDGIRPAMDYLAQCWQKQFGLYVTLKAVSEYELKTAVANRTFDMALCPADNAGKTTLEVLEQFSSYADNYRKGFADQEYDDLLEKAKKAKAGNLSYQQQCEQYLQENFVAMPLFYTRAYFAYSPDLSGLAINPYTRVLDFSKTAKSH